MSKKQSPTRPEYTPQGKRQVDRRVDQEAAHRKAEKAHRQMTTTAAAPAGNCPRCGHPMSTHDPEDGTCDSHRTDGGIGVCQCGREADKQDRVKHSEYILRELKKLRDVQGRIDRLKPILDSAVDGLTRLFAAVEQVETG